MSLKLMLVADIHYCLNLKQEIAATEALLPPGFFNHARKGRLFWHNEMLVEKMDGMIDSLAQLARRENPDLCIFLGDLVNTNWSENIIHISKILKFFPCPTAALMGNHDLYLNAPECRLQDFIAPDEFKTGFRYQLFNKIGLIFLDAFVKQKDGGFKKSFDPKFEFYGVDYRLEDLNAILELLSQYSGKSFLLFCHLPMCLPEDRLQTGNRKIGNASPSTTTVRERLKQPGNLMGIISGHQHFNHLQLFEYGFHWTLPALAEYPCAYAFLESDGQSVKGELRIPNKTLSEQSIAETREKWPYGLNREREFVWKQPFS